MHSSLQEDGLLVRPAIDVINFQTQQLSSLVTLSRHKDTDNIRVLAHQILQPAMGVVKLVVFRPGVIITAAICIRHGLYIQGQTDLGIVVDEFGSKVQAFEKFQKGLDVAGSY
ncbi:hypothetical protein M5D96_003447 [Drosophila gunungcola]|uniref:Uncharacterized protein n=1 Tax=Drosophila gunungcola TaxID=103775 RepID=A0A9P9YS41_9MUSC|nr:hypothetical protein M5D96_003447 [Drosophila gunungcola]